MIWLPTKVLAGGRAPERKTDGAAGLDCYVRGRHRVLPHTTVKIPLGVSMAIPRAHAGLLVLRSSIAAGGRLFAPAVGVIDSDYRSELHAIVTAGDEEVYVGDGERISQLVVVSTPRCVVHEVESLDETERGSGGFGSTGR